MPKILWPHDLEGAREVQERLRRAVIIRPLGQTPRSVAGVDAAFIDDAVVAVASLFSYPSVELIDEAHCVIPCSFPYVPGFLSFREGRATITALKNLKQKPDVVLVDGQGIAHPRGLGIASHIGVLLEMPTIGCAKSRLVGDYEEPGATRGGWTHLIYKGARVGAVLRTREGVRPLFVSPGHLVTLEESIQIVLGSAGRFRIPEPLRRADLVSKKIAKELSGS